MGVARGSLIQKGLCRLPGAGDSWKRLNGGDTSLDQESAQYLCTVGLEHLESSGHDVERLWLQ